MDQKKIEDIIAFHKEWKERCKNTRRHWFFIAYVGLIVGIGILYSYCLPNLYNLLGTLLAAGILTFVAWIHYRSRSFLCKGFLDTYHHLLFFMLEKPKNHEYFKIFWDFETFLGFNKTTPLPKIIKRLRRLPGSKRYNGEHGSDMPVKAYELEDSLEDLAKRHIQVAEAIDTYLSSFTTPAVPQNQ